MIESSQQVRLPIKKLLTGHWREACAGMIIVSITATMISVLLYLPNYLGLSSRGNNISPFQLTTLGFLLYSALTVFFGWLSDRIGRRRQILWGALLMLPAIAVSVWLQENDVETILWLIATIVIAGAVINGAYEAAVIELYPTSVRYSGVAFSHNMGFVLFGGLTPLLLSSLEQAGWRIFPVLILFPVLLLVLMVVYRVPCCSLKTLEYL